MASSVVALEGGGSMEIFANGVKVQRTTDGAELTIYPDGRRLQKEPTGTTIEIFTDGRRIQIQPSGVRLEIFPDGKTIQTHGDGTVIEVIPDGRRIQHNTDGTVIERLADGSRIQTDADGSKIYISRLGKITTSEDSPKAPAATKKTIATAAAAKGKSSKGSSSKKKPRASNAMETRIFALERENRMLKARLDESKSRLAAEKENTATLVKENKRKNETREKTEREFTSEIQKLQRQLAGLEQQGQLGADPARVTQLEEALFNQDKEIEKLNAEYTLRIEELQDQLKIAEKDLTQANNTIRQLKESSEKAVEDQVEALRQEMSNLSKGGNAESVRIQSLRIGKHLNEFTSSITAAHALDERYEKQIKDLKEGLRQKKLALTEQQVEIMELKEENSSLERRIEELIDKGGSVAEDISMLTTHNRSLQAQLDSQALTLEKAEMRLQESHQLLNEREIDIRDLLTRVTQMTEEIGIANGYKEEIETQLNEISELQGDLIAAEIKAAGFESRLEELSKGNEASLNHDLSQIQKKLVEVERLYEESQRKVEAEKNRVSELQEKFGLDTDKLTRDYDLKIKALQTEIKELKSQVKEETPAGKMLSDPVYAKYGRMQKAGLNDEAIRNCMARDGIDPGPFFGTGPSTQPIKKPAGNDFLAKIKGGSTPLRSVPTTTPNRPPQNGPNPNPRFPGAGGAATIAELCKLKAEQRAKRAKQLNNLIRRNSNHPN